jgi:hypothetical protein
VNNLTRQNLLTLNLILLSTIFISSIFAQFPNVKVNQTYSSIEPEEVSIAINPVNPLNLAAGANIDYYYYSTDGGYSWTEGTLTSSFGVWGDPSLTFDASGNLYFAHLSNPPFGYWIDRIVVQKSDDGGMSWNDGVGVGFSPVKEQDKEWIAADQTNSPYHNNLYMAWTEFDNYGSSNPQDSSRILFSRSEDNSLSWSQTIRISDLGGDCLDDDNTVEGAVPAVGPNGEVYLSWSGPAGIMFDKSTDGGQTFGSDIPVTDQPGGWAFNIPGIYRCNGFPVTACDVSNSPYRGTIYVMWSDQRNGLTDTDIFLSKSTNNGADWSSSVRVNNDSTFRHQFFPWMTIDQSNGYIYIVFYDRRNTTGNITEVYVARSTDGGETFTNFPVSESTFLPVDYVFFGDYTNIAAHNGMVYPMWMRMDQGILSVWVAIVEDSILTDIEDYPDVAAAHFQLSQNYPNPFNPRTMIHYQLPVNGRVRLSIHDLLGREITTLVDRQMPGGNHQVIWDATDRPSGIYYYRLQAGNYQAVKKMILVK